MRKFAVAVVLGLGLMLVVAGPAAATSIVEPSGKTIDVGIDEEGYAAAFTVTADGFEPYSSVFIEQCNGRPPNAENWTPTLDCDLGSSPAAAVADADGRVTFSSTDPNHALYPFVGPGPQELFNCLAPNGQSPGNLVEDYTNCQLRISTSNNEATADQVFLAIALPEGARTGWQTPEYPKPAAAANAAGGEQAGSSQSAAGGAKRSAGANASGSDSATDTTSGTGSSDFPLLPVALSIAVVVIGAAFFLMFHKRRSGRVAA